MYFYILIRNRPGRDVLAASLAALFLLLAPTSAYTQAPPHPGGGSSTRPQVPLTPYESALAAKEAGDYQQAIKLLEPEAKSGSGFEIAQLVLGQCYIAASAKMTTPEEAEKARVTGVNWIVRAANSGHAGAQEQLIHLTIEGGPFKVEPAEAGKWYLLWKRNPARFQGGTSELDSKLMRRLKATLTEADWAEAQARADSWKRT